jgi:phenol 2-monooxygenase
LTDVADIIPISDFPDIRYSSTIRSAEHGSLLMIPRERGLVRVYIQLTEVKLGANGRADRSKITPASILQAAQRIMAPYTLKYEYCEWWTAYQIGQRVGTHFDYKSRVFLAGDAVHTHSPKAGQGKWACLNFQATRASQLLTGSVGMNVSMQDSFNLGWKLGLVVKGVAHASILHTYGIERRAIAKELIAFDQKWSRLFSGRPAKDIMDAEGISVEQFRQVMEANVMFFTGLSVDYGGSILVGEERRELASNIKVGMRLASQRVVNQSDGREWELQRKLVSDGRFRIIVFAGNVTSGEQQMRLQGFCRGLRASELLGRYLGKNNIAVLTCHSAQRNQVELLRDVPEVLHPFDSRRGWDYDSVFADDDGHAYGAYGVDRERGCVVVTRPDQHVGQIESVDEAGVAGVEGYFRSVLLVE